VEIYCTNCGESWDLDIVKLTRDDFTMNGTKILHCSCCEENGPAPEERQAKLAKLADGMHEDIQDQWADLALTYVGGLA